MCEDTLKPVPDMTAVLQTWAKRKERIHLDFHHEELVITMMIIIDNPSKWPEVLTCSVEVARNGYV
jgi:hypothetical protein